MWKWIVGLGVAGFLGYGAYDYHRAGFHTAPPLEEGEFLLSFKNGFRGVMRGIEDQRETRRYLGLPVKDVPPWYVDSWSICRPPSQQESERFESSTLAGPGSRLEAVCEIDADGDVFERGLVITVPDV